MLQKSKTRKASIKRLGDGVAFQLMLDTFLRVYGQIRTIDQVIAHHFGLPLGAFAFSKKKQALLQDLFAQVQDLVGSSGNGSLGGAQETGTGGLNRLCLDCRKLAAGCSPQSKAKEVHLLADKAWLEAHTAVQAFVHGVKAEDAGTQKRLPFLGHLVKLTSIINRIAATWPKLLKEFRRDENVLFFLMRRRTDIDELFGSGYLRGILSKLFPSSQESLRKLVVGAYINRGFSYLVPSIEAAVEELGAW